MHAHPAVLDATADRAPEAVLAATPAGAYATMPGAA